MTKQEPGAANDAADKLMKNDDFMKSVGEMVTKAVTTAVEAISDNGNSEKLFTPNINRGAEKDKRTGLHKFHAMAAAFGHAHKRHGAFAPDKASDVLKEWGDDEVAKAVNSINFGEGGALVPTEYVDDIFEALRPISMLRQMPLTIIEMVNGNAVLPGITGGAIAGYKSENAGRDASTVATGDVRLTEKELICIVPMTATMMRSRGGRNATAISNDMLRAMAQAEGENLLNGDGTENQPLGILRQIPAAQSTASAGSTLAAIDQDKKALQSTVRGFNVGVTAETGGYLFDSTIDEDLMALRSGDVKAFPEMANGRFGVYRYGADNTMPAQNMVFGHWPDVVLAESDNIEFTVSNEAAYQDQNGTVRASFSRNETVMRVVLKHDIALRHTEALARKTGVNYT